MNYAFNHEGKAYTPDGDTPEVQTVESTEAENRRKEQAEIEWIKTGPDRLFLYMRRVPSTEGTAIVKYIPEHWQVITWMGTVVCHYAPVGHAYRVPAFGGFPSKRRQVSARIFGVLYHGTYYESSGDYVRLKKAKRQ